MKRNYKETYTLIIDEIRQAMEFIAEEQVEDLCGEIISAEKVFAVGVGRVFLSLQSFVKRLNHLGISAWCVGQVNEPAITKDDLLIAGSGSGESKFPVIIARTAKKYSAKVAYIGSNMDSSISGIADLRVRIPVRTKLKKADEIESRQIMTSLFEQALFLLGDTVSMMISEKKNIVNIDELWQYHANLE